MKYIGTIIIIVLLLGCSNPIQNPGGQVEGEITLLTIPGVEVPKTGAAPVRSIDTEQYTATITWSPGVSSYFVSCMEYSAYITITAKDEYRIETVPENGFKVAGAVTTNNEGTGEVVAVFSETVANQDTIGDIVSANIGTLKAVQGGTFNNGKTDMNVSSFRMGRNEITGEQYAAIMGIGDPSFFASVEENPVESVNWYGAIAFCNRLSIKEGLVPVYKVDGKTNPGTWGAVPTGESSVWNGATADWTANGYRLPTQTEWEYAARGGVNTNNYTYSGSNTLALVAWWFNNSSSTTHKVGTKTGNELGIFDMNGNVDEWCWDLYGPLPTEGPITDYRGPNGWESQLQRIFRGGSWYDNTTTVFGLSFRDSGIPSDTSKYKGFRVVRP